MLASLLILVVEDEPVILEMLEDALVESGFAVAKASSGQQAIASFEVAEADYRGLITDVNLGPGKSGWDVARRARGIHPTLPVVYMTGNSGHQWASEGV